MAEPRPRDTIDTAPRFTAAHAADLDARLAPLPAAQALAALIGDRLAGRVALVSSFGAEAAVLLHMVAQVDSSVPVIFLDTGKHFPETLAYRDALAAKLGLTDLRSLTPDPADLAARDAAGERWSYDPDGCCDLRKVRPLARALAGFDATISGRKAFQAGTRAALPLVEIDASDTAGRLKINPLRDWGKADLDAYFATHTLPRHPLEAQGYPSIGCAPCTSAVAEGEDARAGRWRGFAKVECGIHVGGGSSND